MKREHKIDYATFFDINYLSRGLALLQSLRDHSSSPFKFYVLALDEQTEASLARVAETELVVIPLRSLESAFPELQTAKSNRSKIEYYFTISPFLPSYILKIYNEVEQITTLDADIFFFNDPAVIFDTYPEASVLITPHNFSPGLSHLNAAGIYNVSFQSFKRDDNAFRCLAKWKDDCLEWCRDYFDEKNGRYADQKYLDTWKSQFEGVQDILIPGTGTAPWNLNTYPLTELKGKIFMNGEPLIYFHFHGLRTTGRHFAISGVEGYGASSRNAIVEKIYHTYLNALRMIQDYSGDDMQIAREGLVKRNLIKRLIKTNGYWLYNAHFIVWVNLYRPLRKAKDFLTSLWRN